MGKKAETLAMVANLPRNEEREGTRRLMMWGCSIAAVVFVGFALWFVAPQMFGATDYVGRPTSGADNSAPTTTVGTGVPTQREAISTAAKEDPARNEDSTGRRAREIRQTAGPPNLSDQQREQLRAIFSSAQAPAMDRPNFEMMIGTSIPRQTAVADLPPEATQVLNGFWGDQYLIAGKSLVIVDQHSRRVAAIIANVH
ncbi:hypothetical protein IVB15_10825 [Bradyrhizobium sp. 182]|uniref:DUF1236 domain-containing protein n=1 Tax=unclassified Bradyrhizobium TaxID=2631580 RepID=UPI001FFA91CE|nr:MULTISPECIES: DUF1236 domain-containing protein [unclassified Bradyrhizobium]MCK1421339.1 hypothetical protein [Bradyrhizobium sp. CW12]MCK1528217.1 hypothetical protein [Bradyrhizobium sp. 182]MCK1643443.1 hypothetical protein [Bradyrhizobium sp. 154]